MFTFQYRSVHTYLKNWMVSRAMRLLLALLAVLTLSIVPISSVSTHAASRYQQLRIGTAVCNEWSFPFADANQKVCNLDNIQSAQIEWIDGYNQNGDHVRWEAKDHICEEDGNNVTFVRGWWWDFAREDGVTVRVNGQEFTLAPGYNPDTYWMNVLIVHNFWNTKDFGYQITYKGTDN